MLHKANTQATVIVTCTELAKLLDTYYSVQNIFESQCQPIVGIATKRPYNKFGVQLV
jgi:hypothetical protein